MAMEFFTIAAVFGLDIYFFIQINTNKFNITEMYLYKIQIKNN